MGESMKDYEAMLEESYSLMGDGVHDTDMEKSKRTSGISGEY